MTLEVLALPEHPHDGYEALRAEAVRLAGEPGDIVRRVRVHHELYRASGGNHTFPLVALHGALWAHGYFETTGRLGDSLRARYFYSASERTFRMTMLAGFAEGFKAVNRQVMIDTFTNYYYTLYYGEDDRAAGILHPELFEALVETHGFTDRGEQLSPARKRELFALALEYEQEVTVAPGIQAELEKFDCPVLRFLCLRPVVHLAYFPVQTYLVFRNFSDKRERIARAMRAFDLAAQAGWTHVEATVGLNRLVARSLIEDDRPLLPEVATLPKRSQPA